MPGLRLCQGSESAAEAWCAFPLGSQSAGLPDKTCPQVSGKIPSFGTCSAGVGRMRLSLGSMGSCPSPHFTLDLFETKHCHNLAPTPGDRGH